MNVYRMSDIIALSRAMPDTKYDIFTTGNAHSGGLGGAYNRIYEPEAYGMVSLFGQEDCVFTGLYSTSLQW
jgi:hypothetical protein